MIVLREWQNFRLVKYGADFTLEIDAGIGPEGRYWIPASGMQVFDFIKELGEGWLDNERAN